MAKHLTDKDISNVVETLDDWPVDSKLSWDRLVEAVKHEHKIETTRQTLQKQIRIKTAFHEVKGIVSGKVLSSRPKLPPSLKIASERLETQKRTIERLERENRQLLEQFHVWLYNAHRFGVKVEQLSEALPSRPLSSKVKQKG
ncbi:hypothetical protein [Shewanella psychromarinicola]|uniref:Uncharacterized protein n=1 Tax=Shewanella psychromarinicola TaxID=2487742 RepID=A0A3N4DQN9_9GAMM|nr:hypothetical protein [Shewanella psychromarinicola]AZG34588.1 hypothetical protein EGC80_06395 [Shewanella psychromarinicola]MCL1081737.1 hypothetical protein [Shewanella psychromarinicola]RPA28163.1 hypothetical protein EGC77_15725 [Shewanella psychromarinicola]